MGVTLPAKCIGCGTDGTVRDLAYGGDVANKDGTFSLLCESCMVTLGPALIEFVRRQSKGGPDGKI